MRILGIDHGDKRIGLAISDPLGLIAQPLAVVGNIDEIISTVEKYQPLDKLVVGMPTSLNGKKGPQAQKVLDFIEQLKGHINCSIVTWDERLTSSAANKMLISAGTSREKRKTLVDKTAAALILQSYLDCQK